MLEAPDGVAADMRVLDETPVHGVKRRDAPAKVAVQPLYRLPLRLLKLYRTLQHVVPHVDERQSRLAVVVESLEDFPEEPLPLLYKLAKMVPVDHQTNREQRVRQPPSRLRNETTMSSHSSRCGLIRARNPSGCLPSLTWLYSICRFSSPVRSCTSITTWLSSRSGNAPSFRSFRARL